MWTAATCALALVLQGVPERVPHDSTPLPTTEQIARRVLTLRVRLEAFRGWIERSRDWRPAGWVDSIAALQSGVTQLRAARDLAGMIDGVNHALDSLAHARSPAAARTAAAHAAARLAALLERIEGGGP